MSETPNGSGTSFYEPVTAKQKFGQIIGSTGKTNLQPGQESYNLNLNLQQAAQQAAVQQAAAQQAAQMEMQRGRPNFLMLAGIAAGIYFLFFKK